jgi:ABC-type bacteriocin/lantibiotic exporter with double-glycine peptidase domain
LISSRRYKLCAAVAAAGFLAGGCATQAPLGPAPQLEELTSVPFFPQTEFDCGPAALATVLAESGLAITPEDLLPRVYTAGLKGSLQAEMLAAARSEGRLPILVEPTTQALFDLVATGHPVVVLQNLRLPRAPVWHYAVVVGRETDSGRVVLRSGAQQRKRQRMRRFATTWSLADNWGFIVVRPGEIPAAVAPEGYMRAVIESRHLLSDTDTDAAFTAALSR